MDAFLFGDAVWVGNIKTPGFTLGGKYSSYDIVVVIFNDSFKVSHYENIDIPRREKSYFYLNPRNINYANNYEFEIKRAKKQRLNIHRYYFTEADYNYAKD